MGKQKIHSTTQDFTEISDIYEDIVLFKNKSACSIIEVSSVNFFLLSTDEQNARIYGYMSLLNSLSFPIQILIVSKRVDLSSYLKLLDQKISSTQNPQIHQHLNLYKEFIQELVKGGELLDKKIYVIIPFSSLELGPIPSGKNDFVKKVQEALVTKRTNIISQIERIGLFARQLSGEELAKLYYEAFNEEIVPIAYNSSDIKNVIL